MAYQGLIYGIISACLVLNELIILVYVYGIISIFYRIVKIIFSDDHNFKKAKYSISCLMRLALVLSCLFLFDLWSRHKQMSWDYFAVANLIFTCNIILILMKYYLLKSDSYEMFRSEILRPVNLIFICANISLFYFLLREDVRIIFTHVLIFYYFYDVKDKLQKELRSD